MSRRVTRSSVRLQREVEQAESPQSAVAASKRGALAAGKSRSPIARPGRRTAASARSAISAASSKPSARTTSNPSPKPATATKAAGSSQDARPTTASAQTESLCIYLPTASAFTDWLASNYATAPAGIWLSIAKKGSAAAAAIAPPGQPLTYQEAVDVALCYGWIDGQRRPHAGGDVENFFEQRFTPRRKRSLWSAKNVARVEELVAEGRMHEAGLREVEAAKADGRWDKAYAGSKEMVVADDLRAALGLDGDAKGGGGVGEAGRKFWETLSRTERYSFCWRVETARTPEGRRRMIERVVQMVKEGRTWWPRPQKSRSTGE